MYISMCKSVSIYKITQVLSVQTKTKNRNNWLIYYRKTQYLCAQFDSAPPTLQYYKEPWGWAGVWFERYRLV